MSIDQYVLLILAAGKGTRMGMPKGLLNYGGQPWLLEQLRRFRVAGGSRAIVILGDEAPEYFSRIPGLLDCSRKTKTFEGLLLSCAINEHPERGQFSSLQVGAASAANKAAPPLEGFFVLPVDVPASNPDVWAKLAESLKGQTEAVIPVFGKTGGHPVLLSKVFVEKMLRISPESGDARLDAQLKKLPAGAVTRLSVSDPEVCVNFNTLSEWENFVNAPRRVKVG